MSIRAGVGIAAIFITVLLVSGNAQAASIHLQIDPQKSRITATVADPLARMREDGEIEATLRIISGNVDGDPQDPGATGHIKLIIDATSFDSGNNHRDNVVLGTVLDVSLDSNGTLNGDREVSFNYTDFGVRVPRLLFALPAGSDVTIHFHVTAQRPNSARVNQAARPLHG